MTSIQPTQTPLRFSPKDTNELAQTISESNTVGRRLEIVGGGTKVQGGSEGHDDRDSLTGGAQGCGQIAATRSLHR